MIIRNSELSHLDSLPTHLPAQSLCLSTLTAPYALSHQTSDSLYTDIIKKESKKINKDKHGLSTLFINSEIYNDIRNNRQKYNLFSEIDSKASWETCSRDSELLVYLTSKELDIKFKAFELKDDLRFRRTEVDVHFKSLDQVVKEFCKMFKCGEAKIECPGKQLKRNFVHELGILSDNEDMESSEDEKWLPPQNQLFFLQTESFEDDDTIQELVPRGRSKPVF